MDIEVIEERFKKIIKGIRSDKGSEFKAKMVRRWLSHIGIQTLYKRY